MNLAIMHTYVMKQELNHECDVFHHYFHESETIDTVILIDAQTNEDDGEWKGVT